MRYVVESGGKSNTVAACKTVVDKAETAMQAGFQKALQHGNETDLLPFVADKANIVSLYRVWAPIQKKGKGGLSLSEQKLYKDGYIIEVGAMVKGVTDTQKYNDFMRAISNCGNNGNEITDPENVNR